MSAGLYRRRRSLILWVPATLHIAGFTKGVIDGLDIPACMKGAELSSGVIGSFEPY